MNDNRALLLRQFSFLSQLTDNELNALSGTLKARPLEIGDALFLKGEAGDSMGFLMRGQLQVSLDRVDPTKTIATLYPGETVGEMTCLDPHPRSADVVASERSLVLELDRTMLQALQQNAQPISVAIMRGIVDGLTRRIRETNQRIEQRIDTGTEDPATPAPKTMPPSTNPPSDRVDLRALSCLQSFTNEEIKTLVQNAPPTTYPADAALFREGAHGDSCAILASGSLEVIRQIGGQPRVLAVLQPGAIVGQLALVDQTPRSATIRVREKSILLCFNRERFESLLNQADPMAIRFQHQIAVAGARQLRLANTKLDEVARRFKEAPSPEETQRENQTDEQYFWKYMQTSLDEWGVSLSELDQMKTTRPEGVMSAMETKARMRNKVL